MLKGKYEFTNNSYISIANDIKENHNISVHENVHMTLSASTTIGVLLMMIKKSSLVDNSKNWLMDILIESENKLHEQIATYIEYINIFINSGVDEYTKAINKLKENKPYYSYFKAIVRIAGEIISSDDAVEKINKVIYAALLSLNIDFDELALWQFKNKKDFQRFISIDGNNFRYVPNTRFKYLLKNFFDKSDAEDLIVLDTISSSTFLIAENYIDTLCDSSKKIVEKIYANSAAIERIRKRVSTFERTELMVDANNVSNLSAFPIDFECENEFKFSVLSLNELIEKHNNFSNTILVFEHLIVGLEEFPMLVCTDYQKKLVHYCIYDTNEIMKIIARINGSVIFNKTKLFKRFKNQLYQLQCKNPICIFMDNAIINNFNFIIDEFENGEYSILRSLNYDILVAYKYNILLIQPLVKGLFELQPVVFPNNKMINYKEHIDSIYFNEEKIKLIADTLVLQASIGFNTINSL